MHSEYTILIIDDSKTMLMVYEQMLLSLGFIVYTEQNPTTALSNLNFINPDIIITDYHLGSMTGIDVCKILRKCKKWYYIILITADNDTEILQHAFDNGANDFIKKPINNDELNGRLKNAVHVISTIKNYENTNDQLAQYNSYLENQANELYKQLITDSLTQIHNRRYCQEILERYWNKFIRSECVFSIISIDIDHFKQINDVYGHDAGDVILKEVATVISNSIRVTDIACRYGGEEFIIVCNEHLTDSLYSFCEKIRLAVEKYSSSINMNNNVTISIGAAMSSISLDKSWNDVYKRADIALYNAKHSGRNRVELYK